MEPEWLRERVVLNGWPVDANAGLCSAFHIYVSICTNSTLRMHTLAPKRSRGCSDASERVGNMTKLHILPCGRNNRTFSGSHHLTP